MTLDELFRNPEFRMRVKRRLPPSYWGLLPELLRAVADVARQPLSEPDPLARRR